MFVIPCTGSSVSEQPEKIMGLLKTLKVVDVLRVGACRTGNTDEEWQEEVAKKDTLKI